MQAGLALHSWKSPQHVVTSLVGDQNPQAFSEEWQKQERNLRDAIVRAHNLIHRLQVPDQTLEDIATLCAALGSDGLRGELTLLRAARAYAAWDNNSDFAQSMARGDFADLDT